MRSTCSGTTGLQHGHGDGGSSARAWAAGSRGQEGGQEGGSTAVRCEGCKPRCEQSGVVACRSCFDNGHRQCRRVEQAALPRRGTSDTLESGAGAASLRAAGGPQEGCESGHGGASPSGDALWQSRMHSICAASGRGARRTRRGMRRASPPRTAAGSSLRAWAVQRR